MERQVPALSCQRTHSQKRCKLMDNLSLQEDDSEEETSKTWLAYMMKLELRRDWPVPAWTLCQFAQRCPPGSY